MEHKSPCPTLEQLMRMLEQKTRTLEKHERELGGMNANLEQLLRGQTKIFDCIDKLRIIATENQVNIGNIAKKTDDLTEKIGNGLKEEIAKATIDLAKGEDGLEVEKRFNEVEKKFENIERVMWVPRMLDSKIKKLFAAGLFLAALAGIIITIAYSTASMWGYIKETKFGEKPGLMKSIGAEHGVVIDKNTHIHKSKEGTTYMESHANPDGTPITDGNGVKKNNEK